jgi:hypothetical protein
MSCSACPVTVLGRTGKHVIEKDGPLRRCNYTITQLEGPENIRKMITVQM